MNILGMIVFPFVAKPVFQAIGAGNEKQFNDLMMDRIPLIPAGNIAVLNQF
jgi:hypothetical protein